MATTKDMGILIETLPAKDVILSAEGLSVGGTFFDKLNLVGDSTKIIPTVSIEGSTLISLPVPDGSNAKIRTLKETGTEIKLKRFAEAVEFSNEFSMNTVSDNIAIAKKIALNRIFAGIEYQMLSYGYDGNSAPEEKEMRFERLFPAANESGSSKEKEPLKYKDILKVHEFLRSTGKHKSAFWIISDSAQLSVVDESGNEHLSFKDLPQNAVATLLDLPVYYAQVQDSNDNPIAFGIVNSDSYALAMSDIKVYEPKLDTKQAVAGSKVYIVEVWADAKITDKHSKFCMSFAPQVQQASVETPVKRKSTKIEKE
ncbi:hypothetical protein COJ48_04035 [Bacillus cereus]|nr:hypothetical protein COJ48_04035 [Bacillus cereus]PGP84974.1 hypothetical protein CN997_10410 [Bacillus cereus]